MAGKNVGVDSEADVCVMKELDDPLLVHIERSSYIAPLPNAQRQQSAEPQIIAGAIAAYYQNNLRRTQVGLPALPAVLMPGITIHGTVPVFYRIPVSAQLQGLWLHRHTQKKRLLSSGSSRPLPIQRHTSLTVFVPWDNRRIILRCFEALSPFNLTCLPCLTHFEMQNVMKSQVAVDSLLSLDEVLTTLQRTSICT